MEMIFIVGVLFLLLGLAFDLGRKWERMEWDGSFDEQEASQQMFAPDTACAECQQPYPNHSHTCSLAGS